MDRPDYGRVPFLGLQHWARFGPVTADSQAQVRTLRSPSSWKPEGEEEDMGALERRQVAVAVCSRRRGGSEHACGDCSV